MMVVGGAFGTPVRLVERVDFPGDAFGLLLHSFAEDFSGDDYMVPATGYLGGSEIDFGSSAGRLIAMPGLDAGSIAVWNVLSNDPPQVFASQDATGRVAVAASDADEYVLAFAGSSGSIALTPITCADTCSTPSRTVLLTPSAGVYALPALSEVPGGGDVVLAYVQRQPGLPDIVALQLLTRWLEPRTASSVTVYTLPPGAPNVVDLQIASVTDGDHVVFDLAILSGNPTATTLDLEAVIADSSCYP